MAKWAGGSKIKKVVNNHAGEFPDTITVNVNVNVSGEVRLKQDGSIVGSLGFDGNDGKKSAVKSNLDDIDILPDAKIFNGGRTKTTFGNQTE